MPGTTLGALHGLLLGLSSSKATRLVAQLLELPGFLALATFRFLATSTLVPLSLDAELLAE